MNLPSFETLKRNYLTTHDAAQVLLTIGGKIGNLAPGTNTCVMRMSRAFNMAGKLYDAYNVQDFLRYLAQHYGPPSITRKYAKTEKESSAPFLGKTGIIAWHIEGWTDATGHFTLWDGTTGLYEGAEDYFQTFPIDAVNSHGKTVTIRETQADLWLC